MVEWPELSKFATLAGSVAAVLSIGAFVPQALRIVRRRSAADVSLTMYVVIIVASVLWMFYGYARGSMAVFVTNLVIGVIAVVIALLRIRYGRQ